GTRAASSLCPYSTRFRSRAMSCRRPATVWGSGGFLVQGVDGLEHLVDVIGDLDPAPFFTEHATSVDQESATLDSLDLLAVHDLRSEEHTSELQSRENLVC